MHELGAIFRERDYRKSLNEKTKGHMLKVSKQMTDSGVKGTLSDFKLVEELVEIFREVLYAEQELRNSKKDIMSK